MTEIHSQTITTKIQSYERYNINISINLANYSRVCVLIDDTNATDFSDRSGNTIEVTFGNAYATHYISFDETDTVLNRFIFYTHNINGRFFINDTFVSNSANVDNTMIIYGESHGMASMIVNRFTIHFYV